MENSSAREDQKCRHDPLNVLSNIGIPHHHHHHYYYYYFINYNEEFSCIIGTHVMYY